LFQIQDTKGTVALAKRALFDLDEGIREAALMGLSLRPPEDSRPVFLEGLRYPWAPVAKHAAEALVALKMGETVPDLIRVLEQGDPEGPFEKVEGDKPVLAVRELVRVNHLRNCLLCHSPAFSGTDPVRGLIPAPDQPIPSSLGGAYY